MDWEKNLEYYAANLFSKFDVDIAFAEACRF